MAVVCSIFIGLTPAWVFALGWWLVPGLRGVSATIGLLVFIVVQVIAWPAMCLFWDKTGPHDYTDGVEKKMCHILEKMTPWLAGMLAFAIVLFEMLFWLG